MQIRAPLDVSIVVHETESELKRQNKEKTGTKENTVQNKRLSVPPPIIPFDRSNIWFSDPVYRDLNFYDDVL